MTGSLSGGEAPGAAPPGRLPSGNDPACLRDAAALGWSWAAFLMPYPWLLGHGRLAWGMILVLSAGIPLVGFLHLVLYPAVAFYLGVRGHEVAWTHRAYHSIEQLREGEREWVVWGIVFKALVFLGVVFFAVYFLWFLRQPETQGLLRELGV